MMKIWDIIMQRQITKENSKGIWDYIFWDAANTMLYISPSMLEWIIEHATSSILSSQKPPSEGFFLPAKGFSGANIMVMKCFPTFDDYQGFWWQRGRVAFSLSVPLQPRAAGLHPTNWKMHWTQLIFEEKLRNSSSSKLIQWFVSHQ